MGVFVKILLLKTYIAGDSQPGSTPGCGYLANTSSTFFQGLKDKLSLLVNG